MTPKSNGFSLVKGELVVQNDVAPSGDDCPPDVYKFEFAYGSANLCIRCGALRMAGRYSMEAGIGPLVENGICEDCGNQEGPPNAHAK